jgi:hypothetical protein
MNPGKIRLALLLVLLSASFAWAQKIKVGYDKSTDFSQFKTYAWLPHQGPETIPLLHAKIRLDIDYELEQKGLRKVESDPDVLVTYQAGVNTQSALPAYDTGYTASGGIPPPNTTMWGGSLPASSIDQVVKGTLAVTLVDARHKQTVWSGTVKAKVDYDKQEKMFDQVGKAITEMFKKYPPGKEK